MRNSLAALTKSVADFPDCANTGCPPTRESRKMRRWHYAHASTHPYHLPVTADPEGVLTPAYRVPAQADAPHQKRQDVSYGNEPQCTESERRAQKNTAHDCCREQTQDHPRE